MKTIEIDLNKDKIYREVAKTTAYSGAKRMMAEDTGVYDRTSVSEAEFEMLDRFWNEACMDLANSLSSWLGNVDSASGYVTINVVDTFNFALEESLLFAMQSYMVNSLLTKWYMIANPSLAESVALERIVYKDKIAEIINKRTAPVRRKQSPF